MKKIHTGPPPPPQWWVLIKTRKKVAAKIDKRDRKNKQVQGSAACIAVAVAVRKYLDGKCIVVDDGHAAFDEQGNSVRVALVSECERDSEEERLVCLAILK